MLEDDHYFTTFGYEQRGLGRGVQEIRGQTDRFVTDSRGLLTQCEQILVPVSRGVHQKILEETHKSRFSINPGAPRCIEP